MDPATLATGFTTNLTALTDNFGPIILTVVGIALGLYGIRLVYGWLTTFVRARAR